MQASISHSGVNQYLGLYPTKELAAKAYKDAARKFNNENDETERLDIIGEGNTSVT